jgi:hypothetical protein
MIKSKLLCSLILLLPLSAFATEIIGHNQSVADDGKTNKSSIIAHDNVLCAADNDRKVKMSIEYVDHSISKGQPFDYAINAPSGGDNDGCIIVRAGRNKTQQVVNDAKNLANNITWNKYNMGVTKSTEASGYTDTTPKELNFAVKANITFTFKNNVSYYCPNVIIAQGSSAAMNNWWLISNMNNDDENNLYVELSCDSGILYFYKFGYALSPVNLYFKKDRLQITY